MSTSSRQAKRKEATSNLAAWLTKVNVLEVKDFDEGARPLKPGEGENWPQDLFCGAAGPVLMECSGMM